jgi:hypothetical protein
LFVVDSKLQGMNLTIEQRDKLRAILPQYEQKGTGRKRADTVQVLEGICGCFNVVASMWLLQCGCFPHERVGRTLTSKSMLRTKRVIVVFKNGHNRACLSGR